MATPITIDSTFYPSPSAGWYHYAGIGGSLYAVDAFVPGAGECTTDAVEHDKLRQTTMSHVAPEFASLTTQRQALVRARPCAGFSLRLSRRHRTPEPVAAKDAHQ